MRSCVSNGERRKGQAKAELARYVDCTLSERLGTLVRACTNQPQPQPRKDSLMQLSKLLCASAGGLLVLALAGCDHDEHYRRRDDVVISQPPPVNYYRVEPGYYYDRGHYDAEGIYHTPMYYHYYGVRCER